MSDLVLKSPLLTGLNFKYSQESVIRFVGKRDVAFFDCHRVPEKTVIDLINYCITHSDEGFHVSYNTYKAGIPLYITPDKLASKPYWFNQADYTELFRSSALTNYFSLPLSESLIEQIDDASKTMNIQKGHLMMLATLTEFSPNPWTGKRTTPFESLIDCAVNLESFDFTKPSMDYTHKASGLSWSDISDGLKKITNKNAYDTEKLKNFIIDAKNDFNEYKTKLKDDMVLDNFQYTVRGCRADGVVLHTDKLPAVFSLRTLDALFTQNIEYYKHVLYLEIHDPFEDEVFLYYPSLTNVLKDEVAKSIFFSIPASFFFWLTTICGSSLRSRNSTLRQAVINFIPTWKKQWSAVPKEKKEKAIEAFSLLHSKVQPNQSYEVYEYIEGIDGEEGKRVVRISRGRGRPPKDPTAPRKPKKPKPPKIFDEKGNEIKRGRGRPPKDPTGIKKPKPLAVFDAEGKEIKRGRGRPPRDPNAPKTLRAKKDPNAPKTPRVKKDPNAPKTPRAKKDPNAPKTPRVKKVSTKESNKELQNSQSKTDAEIVNTNSQEDNV